jgi:hypothetical protein
MENSSSGVELSSKDGEVSISENLSSAHIHKLLEDKNKTRNYIKSCKNIMKKQSDQLKRQQAEFKNAVSTLETQSFTTRFHSVAFKLELDVMRLINIRRRYDCVFKKKVFSKFASQINKIKFAEYCKIRGAVSLLKLGIGNIIRYIKNKRKIKLKLGFQGIVLKSLINNQDSPRNKLEVLKKENFDLKITLNDLGKNSSLEEILEENKRLKEKLKVTEQSVGNFIKEMGNLLSSHEPPGFTNESESPKPSAKAKKGKKPKSRVHLISPDRVELPSKKHRTTRVNFD